MCISWYETLLLFWSALLQSRATVLLLPSQGVPFTWKSGTFITIIRKAKIVIFHRYERRDQRPVGSYGIKLHFYGSLDDLFWFYSVACYRVNFTFTILLGTQDATHCIYPCYVLTPLSGQFDPWLGWSPVVGAPLSDTNTTIVWSSIWFSFSANMTFPTDSSSFQTMAARKQLVEKRPHRNLSLMYDFRSSRRLL